MTGGWNLFGSGGFEEWEDSRELPSKLDGNVIWDSLQLIQTDEEAEM